MLRAEILEYYQRGGETRRLGAGTGRLEFLRTWDILSRTLPPAPARIADVGGATGVYAAPLAAAGYQVTVVDPVPEHVAASAGLAGVRAIEGDARALPLSDGEMDAVLLLGPLYHLPQRADRITAWREAARVVRTGGLVAGAVISRFASLLDGVAKSLFAEPGFADLVDEALVDGVHRSGERGLPWFTSAYFHRPEEPASEAAEAGLTGTRTVMVEGPVWIAGGERLDGLLGDPATAEVVLSRLRAVEEEQSLLGASSHLLTLARRPPV